MAGTAWTRGARIANAHVDVTPSDLEDSTTVLPPTTVALYIGSGGDVEAQMWGTDTDVIYTGVAGGAYLEGNFKYVKALSTSAGAIVALYVL